MQKTVKKLKEKQVLNKGDIVRYYINPKEYILGEVVELCEDGTVWVRHNNGQERNYSVGILTLNQE